MGGEKYIPRWKNDREMNRFIDLCFKHMNDIAERLSEYPDQFEPMFGYNDVDGQSYTVVEEWCYGYMRGVSLTDWSALPEELKADLDVIALHGAEENSEKLDALSEEEFIASIERIQPAALRLYDYWSANPQQPEAKNRLLTAQRSGVTIRVLAAAGRSLRAAACTDKKGAVDSPIFFTPLPAAFPPQSKIAPE